MIDRLRTMIPTLRAAVEAARANSVAADEVAQ